MSFAVGSLVKARGREWVVLPESGEEMLILRPLGGSEDEVTGIFMPLERVDPATFDCRIRRSAVTSARAACCAMPCGWVSVRAPGRFARSRA